MELQGGSFDSELQNLNKTFSHMKRKILSRQVNRDNDRSNSSHFYKLTKAEVDKYLYDQRNSKSTVKTRARIKKHLQAPASINIVSNNYVDDYK